MADIVTTSSQSASKATSRLAMLTAFIAGAFAAWILITINLEQQRTAEEERLSSSVNVPHQIVSPKPAKPVKSAAGVTVHSGAPKSGTVAP